MHQDQPVLSSSRDSDEAAARAAGPSQVRSVAACTSSAMTATSDPLAPNTGWATDAAPRVISSSAKPKQTSRGSAEAAWRAARIDGVPIRREGRVGFLAGDRSSYVTGQELLVDRGLNRGPTGLIAA